MFLISRVAKATCQLVMLAAYFGGIASIVLLIMVMLNV